MCELKEGTETNKQKKNEQQNQKSCKELSLLISYINPSLAFQQAHHHTTQ